MVSFFLNATSSKNVVFDFTNNKKANITLYDKSGKPFLSTSSSAMLERHAGLGVYVQIAQDLNSLNKSPEI